MSLFAKAVLIGGSVSGSRNNIDDFKGKFNLVSSPFRDAFPFEFETLCSVV